MLGVPGAYKRREAAHRGAYKLLGVPMEIIKE